MTVVYEVAQRRQKQPQKLRDIERQYVQKVFSFLFESYEGSVVVLLIFVDI